MIRYLKNLKWRHSGGNRPKILKKFSDLWKISLGATITFCGVCLYTNNEKFFRSIAMPLFHLIDPEDAHKLAVFLTKYKLVPQSKLIPSTILQTTVNGLEFSSPVGIAAGYDKSGECVEGLAKIGFSFVEVGSVTPFPQEGNPKPRLFRLKDEEGIINRYGFNNDGHEVVRNRLSRLPFANDRNYVLGVNLGKNKTSTDSLNDYVAGINFFNSVADYFVVNISSPNTPGLRDLQKKEQLSAFLSSLLERKRNFGISKPLYLKLSPDLSLEEKKDIVSVIKQEKCRVDGLIICNTTTRRDTLDKCQHRNESGGLSGEPLKQIANEALKDFYLLTKGDIPLIAVGGISSGRDAFERIENGASLVQIYSSLTFHGPPLVNKIQRELKSILEENEFSSVKEAVGSKLKGG